MTIRAPEKRQPTWLAPLVCLFALAYQADVAFASDAPLQDGPLASKTDGNNDKNTEVWTQRRPSHHVGLTVGTARFNVPCIDGMVCKRSGRAVTLYAGGDLSQRWGFELAYMRMSNLQKDGNALRVKGVNVNLLGELPFATGWKLTGRVGTNYAWTRMDQGITAAEPNGKARGFGLSYGAGLSVDFAERWTATADVNRHDLKFVTGRESVDTASIGVRYRY